MSRFSESCLIQHHTSSPCNRSARYPPGSAARNSRIPWATHDGFCTWSAHLPERQVPLLADHAAVSICYCRHRAKMIREQILHPRSRRSWPRSCRQSSSISFACACSVFLAEFADKMRRDRHTYLEGLPYAVVDALTVAPEMFLR